MTGPERPKMREQHRQVDVVPLFHPRGKRGPEPRARFPYCAASQPVCRLRCRSGCVVYPGLTPWVPHLHFSPGGPPSAILATPGGHPFPFPHVQCAASGARLVDASADNNILLPAVLTVHGKLITSLGGSLPTQRSHQRFRSRHTAGNNILLSAETSSSR